MTEQFFDSRVADLKERPVNGAGSCVVYWMQRSQWAFGNLALSFAIDRANEATAGSQSQMRRCLLSQRKL